MINLFGKKKQTLKVDLTTVDRLENKDKVLIERNGSMKRIDSSLIGGGGGGSSAGSADDIEVLNMMSDCDFGTPISDSEGNIITDSNNNIILG